MIKGKKVLLRPVEERDLPLLARWRNAPENRRFFFSPFLVNPGGQKKWYEALLADHSRVVMMVDTLEGQTVGLMGLDNIDWLNQQADGWGILLDPDQRGRGYAEEAMALGLDYAFFELNLHRVNGFAYPSNKAILLYEFFGFRQEGVLRQAVFSGGRFQDKVMLGLLREEWEREQADGSTD